MVEDHHVNCRPPNGDAELDHVNARFCDLEHVRFAQTSAADEDRCLTIVFLADDRHPANVVMDHIASFALHSQHRVIVINPIHTLPGDTLASFSCDAIVIHYSIFVLGDYFLPWDWKMFIYNFPGIKAQIIQDEHRHVERMKRKMSELGVNLVFSSLDVSNCEKVYGGEILGKISFFSCLPGYVTSKLKEIDCLPIEQRQLDVVYRGRELPYKLGLHGQEKELIGVQMQELAHLHGLKVDINSNENSRIYGEAWYAFLQMGRATLGVEGGASIFDFHDELDLVIEEYLTEHSGAGFEEVWQAVLAPYEGNIVHKTITPRLFEAIATKTALVLYPGQYRGILEPNRHYIPMERDGSNADELVLKLRDAVYLQELVDRTYDEILGRFNLSMEFYVLQFDQILLDVHQRHFQKKGTFLLRIQACILFAASLWPYHLRRRKDQLRDKLLKIKKDAYKAYEQF